MYFRRSVRNSTTPGRARSGKAQERDEKNSKTRNPERVCEKHGHLQSSNYHTLCSQDGLHDVRVSLSICMSGTRQVPRPKPDTPATIATPVATGFDPNGLLLLEKHGLVTVLLHVADPACPAESTPPLPCSKDEVPSTILELDTAMPDECVCVGTLSACALGSPTKLLSPRISSVPTSFERKEPPFCACISSIVFPADTF